MIFSIIIAVRNSAEALELTLSSILSQTHPSIELFIVDAASTDKTMHIVGRYRDRIKYFISEPDMGIYDAWNKALPKISESWVCFLGAGDRFSADTTLELLDPYVERAEKDGAMLVYGKTTVVNAFGNPLYVVGQPWKDCKSSYILHGEGLCHTGLFHNSKIFQHRRFDPTFRIAGDYEFLLHIIDTVEVSYVDIDITTMVIGGVSSVPKYRLIALREFAKARKINGVPPHPLRWHWLMVKTYCRIAFQSVLGKDAANRLADAYRRARGRPPIWTDRAFK